MVTRTRLNVRLHVHCPSCFILTHFGRHQAVPWFRRCHGSGGLSPSNHGGLGSLPGQLLRKLWWTKWQWDRFLSQYLTILPVIIIPPLLHTFFSSQRSTLSTAYLYQKDDRALPRNFQSSKFCSPPVLNAISSTALLVLLLSLQASKYYNAFVFPHLSL